MDRVEAELLAAAQRQHAVELGRTARRLLARPDPDAANAAEERRHRRRRCSIVQTADGMTRIVGEVTGLDAEVVNAAARAFTTPDLPGEPARTPEQRTADGLVAALRAALDGGSAPADRGVKPHVVVLVPMSDQPEPADDTCPGTADGAPLGPVAELTWTGPIPTHQIRRLLTDAHIRLLGIDLRGVPLAMTQTVTQPTAALYLALIARDGGCRYPGCDAPPAWCDIAHATARRDHGPLTIHNALLLCRYHHRKLDLGRWTITIDGPHATFTRAGRTICAGPARGRPPDTS